MAKFSLTPFEAALAPTISLDCELNQTHDSIFISYKLQGALGSLDLGTDTPKHARVMKLWEKTCFELFIKNVHDSYIEFNFSPEFEWNCFYFAKRGEALNEYPKMDLVKFDILLSLEVVHVIVEIDKKKFPDAFLTGELSIGISSVIKDKSAHLSYWALSHKDSRPNFHDFRSFIPLA